MKIPRIKLKNQLVLINAFTKLLIIAVILFAIPFLVTRFSIKQTDENLIRRLDDMLLITDSLGIDSFVGAGGEPGVYGSYNIMKEEFVTIELMENDTLLNYIGYSERLVDNIRIDYRVLSYSFEMGGSYYLIEIGESIEGIITFQGLLLRYAIIFMVLLLGATVLIELFFVNLLIRPLDKIVKNIKSSESPNSFSFDKVATNTSDFIYLQDTIESQMLKIEKAFNAEREYIGNVSHELLTPISIIRSKLENIIIEGKLSEEDLIKIFESKKTLGRLTLMVRSLLMFSRLENEEYALKDKVDIKATVQNVIDELSDRLQAKGLSIEFEWQADRTTLLGNRELLFNMFYNLLNNAIKYTENGGISIFVATKIDKVEVSITDTGQGMDPETVTDLFTRFGKHDPDGEGFGLGLALVKKICDYHSISISVDSVPGSGSTFSLVMSLD